jgi:3-isopropylmalate/(R)-2-methylmalate dehydratase large subunit
MLNNSITFSGEIMGHTLFDKIWQQHVVESLTEGVDLIHVDRHLLHEVSSPQAFDGLVQKSRAVFSPKLSVGVTDHIVSTQIDGTYSIDAKEMIETLRTNTKKNNIRHFDVGSQEQGIVHVTAPEQGLITPGMTVVCGDSHTCTLGALGAIAFGIGTTEVEHVLATQTIRQKKPKNFRIQLNGKLAEYVTAKDVILYIIRQIGVSAATGDAIEFCGEFVKQLSMEGRFTLCNLSIEAGAKVGLIAPDEITFDYLKYKLKYLTEEELATAIQQWKTLHSDSDALFEKEIEFDVSQIQPHVSWGTSVSESISFNECLPERIGHEKAFTYMDLEPKTRLQDIKIDYVFIGSCTNSRLPDLIAAAKIVKGKRLAPWVRALVVPGSEKIKQQAEAMGLSEIFIRAGFEWRNAGCSMCVSLNDDRVPPGKRCVSTSNRNFEGRQGPGSRTHLASPVIAAASAIKGYIAQPQELSL